MPTNPSGDPARRSTSSRLIRIGNLNSRDFAPYGEVIQNPSQDSGIRLQKIVANQGTATKWLDVTNMKNWYELAPSKTPAEAVVNMFVCAPRQLEVEEGKRLFPVKILERHPFTPQTFIPLGVSASDKDTRYLVIVAPTLTPTGGDSSNDTAGIYPREKVKWNDWGLLERVFGSRPSTDTDDHNAATTILPEMADLDSAYKPKGPGGPDLDHLQAFVARGDQAVTYGPGTWHAPMVVLGSKEIDFVVLQFANGIGTEDCQERNVQDNIAVAIDEGTNEASALGTMRARL